MRVRRHLPAGWPLGRWMARWAAGGRRLLRRPVALGAATLLGAMALGYLVAAVVLFPAPILTAHQTVPPVIGLTEDAARQALAAHRLRSERVEARRHPTAPPGTVVWQDPPAGVVVPEGTGVQLTVSQGPQRIPVPDVIGYHQAVGETLIEAAGLRVGGVDPAQTAAPQGVVVNTRPPAGTALVPGSRVTLVVSVGAPTITVPDLAGLTLEEARAALEQAGLALGTYFRRTASARPGTVIEQRPAAGTLAAPGAAVDVVLARRGPS